MNIQLSTLHPNVKTLASRLVDLKHQGGGTIQADSLDSIEKRFLQRKEISYSFNTDNKNWEISIKTQDNE